MRQPASSLLQCLSPSLDETSSSGVPCESWLCGELLNPILCSTGPSGHRGPRVGNAVPGGCEVRLTSPVCCGCCLPGVPVPQEPPAHSWLLPPFQGPGGHVPAVLSLGLQSLPARWPCPAPDWLSSLFLSPAWPQGTLGFRTQQGTAAIMVGGIPVLPPSCILRKPEPSS